MFNKRIFLTFVFAAHSPKCLSPLLDPSGET